MALFERIMDIVPEVLAEGKRQAIQGSMEAANALFHGSNAFVPYGPGAYPQSTEIEPQQQTQEATMPQHEYGGMER